MNLVAEATHGRSESTKQ